MTLFDQLVNTLLSAESIIEEAKRNIEDDTGEDEKAGAEAEFKFHQVLKKRFGSGKFFQHRKTQPTGVFTRANKELKNGLIAWYSSSEHQDKIQHIDFLVNTEAKPLPNDSETEYLVKQQFNLIIDLGAEDVDTVEFNEYWEAPEFEKERETAYDMISSKVEKHNNIDIRGYEVKSYKGDTKVMHRNGSATMVETVGGGGHLGWLYSKADYIAYRENSLLKLPSRRGSDISDGFVVIDRMQLANYVNNKINKEEETENKYDAWYKQYRRRDKDGNLKKDLVVHIDLMDAKKNGVYMEFWRD